MTALLRLQLATPVGDSPDQQSRTLTTGSLHIGRDDDNDWVLDDGSRLLSRRHCTITANSGLFVIIDSSANGLFINDAKQPLGRGNSAILSNGDVLRMGNLAIRVEVAETFVTEADPFRAILPRLGAPEVPAPAPEADPLDSPLPGAIFSSLAASPPPDWDTFGLRPLPSLPGAAPQQAALTISDHLPAEQEAILPMRVASTTIPEDWDAELGFGAPGGGPRPAPAFGPDFGPPDFGPPDAGSRRGPAAMPLSVPPLSAPPSAAPSPAATPPAATPPAAVAPAAPPVFAALATPSRAAPAAPAPVAATPASSPQDVAVALIEALARIEGETLAADEVRVLAGPPEAVLARLQEDEAEWIGLTLTALTARVIARMKQGAPAPDPVSETPAPAPFARPYIPEGDLS